MFLSLHMPGARQAPELALLSATVRASMAGEAAGCGRGDQRALGGKPGVLRLPADPRLAQAPRSGLRSQDGVANHAPAWVAGDRSAPAGALRATARGAGAGGRIEPAVGVGHHGHPGVGWPEGALGDHDRLCGPDGAGVALRQADHGRGSRRDAAGGRLPAIRRGSNPRSGDRVPQRQWAGVHLASVSPLRAGDGADPVPYAPTEPGVERVGGGVLRELQAGLRVPGVPGDVREGGAPGATVDRALQSAGPAQRLGDAVARRVLRGRESQKQDTTCPNLRGAVHAILESV